LRDLGGIIVIDFIDMVLESNRELVLRRLLECLARDRTKHQVAEVTSLGLVQMTRKRVGSGLLEAFSVPCEHCNGRGVITSLEPVDHSHGRDSAGRDSGGQDGGGKGGQSGRNRNGNRAGAPSPASAARVPVPGPAADGSRQHSGSNGAPAGDAGAEGVSSEVSVEVVADLADARVDGSSSDATAADRTRSGRSRSGRGRRSGAKARNATSADAQHQAAEEHQAVEEHPAAEGPPAAEDHPAVEPASS
jgi:ribonuclease E